MAKVMKLNIITPGREIIRENILNLITTETDGKVEILANHVPIIASTVPTVSSYKTEDGEIKRVFTSHGIIYIKDNEINFCCDSVNFKEELDIERAEKSRDRAIKRLELKKDIDIERAKKSLERALARLELK